VAARPLNLRAFTRFPAGRRVNVTHLGLRRSDLGDHLIATGAVGPGWVPRRAVSRWALIFADTPGIAAPGSQRAQVNGEVIRRVHGVRVVLAEHAAAGSPR